MIQAIAERSRVRIAGEKREREEAAQAAAVCESSSDKKCKDINSSAATEINAQGAVVHVA